MKTKDKPLIDVDRDALIEVFRRWMLGYTADPSAYHDVQPGDDATEYGQEAANHFLGIVAGMVAGVPAESAG